MCDDVSTDGSVGDDAAASTAGADDTAPNAADTSMTSPSKTTSGGGSSSNAIKFMLVTRRGNKQHFSSLDVPISDQLAAKYRQREEVSTGS